MEGGTEVGGKGKRTQKGVSKCLVLGEGKEGNCLLQDEGNSTPTVISPAVQI